MAIPCSIHSENSAHDRSQLDLSEEQLSHLPACKCVRREQILDHFFANHGLGEKKVHLHCDNCSGQKKNNYLLWYLAWRVMHSLHLSVSLNFLITGHTKFGPDWCFGLIKQNYRRHMVSCLEDIVDVVKTSPVTGVNIPQKVGSEDGEVEVPQADWQSFLRPFFLLMKGIKEYRHFRFVAARGTIGSGVQTGIFRFRRGEVWTASGLNQSCHLGWTTTGNGTCTKKFRSFAPRIPGRGRRRGSGRSGRH